MDGETKRVGTNPEKIAWALAVCLWPFVNLVGKRQSCNAVFNTHSCIHMLCFVRICNTCSSKIIFIFHIYIYIVGICIIMSLLASVPNFIVGMNMHTTWVSLFKGSLLGVVLSNCTSPT